MTDKLSGYSTTPGSNNAAVPDGWPEGMLPSDVNNCAREGMARVREWYEDAAWINLGHTVVSATSSTIVVSGDQTSFYVAGRALRADGTDYGWVSSSTYGAPNTTINVTGFSVSGTPTTVEVGILSASNQIPRSLTIQNLNVSSFTAGNIPASSFCPVGSIMDFAMNSPPTGWLECDGTAISRTTYASLFSAVGTTWGAGDGSSTFNLPDFRGEFRRGWDHGRGVDSGRAFASSQADELKAHAHTTGIVGAITVQLGPAYPVVTSGNTGSTGGSETRPRNIAVLTCIKT